MAEPKRYFINNLSSEVQMDRNLQKQRVESLMHSVIENFKPSSQTIDGGLYVGVAGVAYMFYHVAKLESFSESRPLYLQLAEKNIQLPLKAAIQGLNSTPLRDKTSFLTGNVGLFAVGAAIYNKLGKADLQARCLSQFEAVAQLLKPITVFGTGSDELFVGRTGYLCALLWLRKELGITVVNDSLVFELLDATVESGKAYSTSVKSPVPLMYQYYGTEYLGPAHGLSGILFILLRFPSWLQSRPHHLQLIKSSIDVLLLFQTSNGNFPCAMDEVQRQRPVADELVHWCHGAPGTIFVLAEAFKLFKEEKYLKAALKCFDVTWQKGLLKKGPGICHGVAGSGYVFLVLHKLTKNPIFLQKAWHFMDFIYTDDFKRAKKPDSPYSLYEGTAGTVCFAADLLHPQSAQFPFFEV